MLYLLALADRREVWEVRRMRLAPLDARREAPVRKQKRRRFRLDDLELSLLSLPTVLWFIAFCYVPMFGIVFAFKNYKYRPGKGFLYSLFVSSRWVGLKNFEFLFRSPDIRNIFRNTIGYNIAFICIGVTLPVALAIMMTHLHSRKLAKVCQTAVFLPHFLSWVVVSYFVYAFLSTDKGLINAMLASMGMKRVMWYQESAYWPGLLIFINTWKTFGYSMVVYMATITGIDQTLYESAVIDGADQMAADALHYPAAAAPGHLHYVYHERGTYLFHGLRPVFSGHPRLKLPYQCNADPGRVCIQGADAIP